MILGPGLDLLNKQIYSWWSHYTVHKYHVPYCTVCTLLIVNFLFKQYEIILNFLYSFSYFLEMLIFQSLFLLSKFLYTLPHLFLFLPAHLLHISSIDQEKLELRSLRRLTGFLTSLVKDMDLTFKGLLVLLEGFDKKYSSRTFLFKLF